ncbi:hypothetical protein K431DRAFT_262555 [Polychaeton citri CBS 116435]|uniref:Uncharacterized protein n=1 Tax=Polychaeton citri CBS 116435 TaxID=1314669 RepID=A0A9P4QGZ7_9PEZI|nr:hypothetical protein K431DRAFT_262555 [Polychaeton citri CBS 116435]
MTALYVISIPIAISLVLVLLLRKVQAWQSRRQRASTPSLEEVKGVLFDPYEAIEPVGNGFVLDKTEPIKLRPFRPKYFLTMSLENTTLSDFILMDKTYVGRANLRRQLIKDHQDATVQCNHSAEAAVKEFYRWTTGTYLPRRYPMLYRLEAPHPESEKQQSQLLKNLVTGASSPTDADAMSPIDCLKTLGETVDTDFLFLLPSSTAPDGSPIYHLQAFVTCFPSGFSTRQKLGLPLAQIHAPVPGYAAKLEKSMDRFFARVEVGKIVKRANWSITTDDVLFCEEGTHIRENEDGEAGAEPKNERMLEANEHSIEEDIERQRENVKIENCRLRVERQTLHRLPVSKALVFAFKTYQERLEDVKADGDGNTLADAIDGLGIGNVPGMRVYKRGVVWGDRVAAYLRQ